MFHFSCAKTLDFISILDNFLISIHREIKKKHYYGDNIEFYTYISSFTHDVTDVTRQAKTKEKDIKISDKQTSNKKQNFITEILFWEFRNKRQDK